jgi:hypothetical protein
MSKLDIKYFYRYLIPEAYRISFYHTRQNYQKNFRLWFGKKTDKNVRLMGERLSLLRDVYKGQRCFIMGNGPSLNKMDLNLFRDEVIWGSNRCYLLFDRINWRPKFYVAVDTRVVPDNAEEINSLKNLLPEALFFFPVNFRLKGTLRSASNVYWFNEIPLSKDDLPYSMFSSNPSAFVYSANTVSVTMLQLAVYLGFNPIYLIGCDTSYSIPKSVKFEKGDPNLIISTEDDPNHFDTSYFGDGKKWHDPHVENMIFNYEQVKKYCDTKNLEIINATIGGNLEVFPRINYFELF